jgi:hypothetical protein
MSEIIALGFLLGIIGLSAGGIIEKTIEGIIRWVK